MKKIAIKYLGLLSVTFLIVTTAVVFANFILDPFQIYRVSVINPDHYVKGQERYQNAGLINRLWMENACCETILIGTSHSQNFDGEEIGIRLGVGKVLNLSMSGANPYEEYKILQRVAELRAPKTIIWELHTPFSEEKDYSDDRENIRGKFFPDFLYDGHAINDAGYLFSIDTLKFGIKQIASSYDLYSHKSWYAENLTSFNNGEVLFNKAPEGFQKKYQKHNDSTDNSNIRNYILPAIESLPEARFIFFFPPYSLHYFASMRQEEFERIISFRQQLVGNLKPYRNVKIYAFEPYIKELDDLDLYKDLAHYHPDIGGKAVTLMANGVAELNEENFQTYSQSLLAALDRYCIRLERGCQK